ncbi:aspartic proteinase precursor [Tieghemiomyces parasiticus]|uniref:Aspartic proteinase n=1 Tax=Tieghemiomyces parasiticus TaxID=78921 RepID=A0A9W7ZF52_9FUNG|nr:aspartic proteinase precursor [Tieghemiomyces parasiticus]
MILGGVDAARFQAPLLYVPVVKRKYWEVELRGMTVGGGNAGRRPKQGASDSPLDLQAQTAIIDTGTTLILMNEGDADTVNAAVGASRDGSSGKLYSITCDTSSLPAVTLHLGDYAFSLPPEAYVVPGRDGSCSTGFSVSSMPTQWIVGNTFLRYYYSVYDASSHRVGFGKSI